MQNIKEETRTIINNNADVKAHLNDEIDLSFDEPSDAPSDDNHEHHAPVNKAAINSTANSKTSVKKMVLMIAVAIAILLSSVVGIRYYNFAMSHESTDDAFIEGHVIAISPKVIGHVDKIYVEDNQIVKKGDLILEIDSRDFEARLAQAQGALDAAIAKQKSAETNVTLTQVTSGAGVEQAASSVQLAKSGVNTATAQSAAARERVDQARLQVVTAQTNVEQTQAEIKAAQAEATRAQTDADRYQKLYDQDEVSRQQLDHAIAAATQANAQLEVAHKKVAANQARVAEARAAEQAATQNLHQAESQTSEAQARVGEALGRLNQASAAPQQVAVSRYQVETVKAEIKQLEAAVKQAELELSYTKIYAPEDGRITRKTVEQGAFVQIGQSMLAIVPNNVWVVANFKETQLSQMRPGQPVEIKVDAYPDRTFQGHVDSIQSGSGARFSLLPPENATGNYVKVVQRVPVKIVFDELPDANHIVAPGMSVEPAVKVN